VRERGRTPRPTACCREDAWRGRRSDLQRRVRSPAKAAPAHIAIVEPITTAVTSALDPLVGAGVTSPSRSTHTGTRAPALSWARTMTGTTCGTPRASTYRAGTAARGGWPVWTPAVPGGTGASNTASTRLSAAASCRPCSRAAAWWSTPLLTAPISASRNSALSSHAVAFWIRSVRRGRSRPASGRCSGSAGIPVPVGCVRDLHTRRSLVALAHDQSRRCARACSPTARTGLAFEM
jgi:hypothetical protein